METNKAEDITPRRPFIKRNAKRVALVMVLMFVIVIAAHGVWYRLETNQLNHAIAAIKERGEPTTLADLQPVLPAITDNGWFVLAKSFEILRRDTAISEVVHHADFDPALPLRDKEREALQTFCQERAEVLAYIDQADAKAYCVITDRIESIFETGSTGKMTDLRAAAHFLHMQSMVDFDKGSHADAMKHVGQISILLEAGKSYRSLVGYYVVEGIRAMQVQAYIDMSVELKVSDKAEDVSPATVRQIIARLLDFSESDAEFVKFCAGERAMQLDAMRLLEKGKYKPSKRTADDASIAPVRRYFLAPMIRSNMNALIDIWTVYMQACAKSDYPSMRSVIDQPDGKLAKIRDSKINLLASIMLPSYERLPQHICQRKTDRSLAACALAMRLYRHDHAGKWPENLEALIPTYLPSLPMDYMAAKLPLNYRGGESPILWSVGDNGLDDGGDDQAVGKYQSVWQRLDRVVYLTQQPRQDEEKAESENGGAEVGENKDVAP